MILFQFKYLVSIPWFHGDRPFKSNKPVPNSSEKTDVA